MQSNWYPAGKLIDRQYWYKAGKMLAYLPHYSVTLQGYTTNLRTFNVHELTTSIGKWMSWSRGSWGKAGGKKIFVSLCNLSSERLETYKSSISECSRRFKQLAFSRFILSREKTNCVEKLCCFTRVSCSIN